MTPPPQQQQMPNIPDKPPTVQGSTLGGNAAIGQRYKEFLAKESGATKEAPLEKQEAPKQDVQQKEAPASTESTKASILPPEKEIPKTAKEEAKVQSTEQTKTTEKVGSDGLTKGEREELVRFKTEAAQKTERVTELEQKVKDYDITTKELAELKKLKTDLEEKAKVYEAKAMAFDVTATPYFKEKITEPMDRLDKALRSIITDAKLDGDAVYSALNNPNMAKSNEALSEFIQSLDPLTSRSFERIVNDMRTINEQAMGIIEKAPEAWTAIEQENKKRAEESKTKASETYRMANNAVFDAFTERLPFLKEGEMGKQVHQEAASVDWENLSPDKKAYFAQSGYIMPYVNSLLKAKDEEISSLKKALGRDSAPGPAQGTQPLQEQKQEKEEKIDLGKLTSGQRFQLFREGKIAV